MRLAEEGRLRTCPICKTPGWRGEAVNWRYGGRASHPGEEQAPPQPVAIQGRAHRPNPAEEDGYETDLEDDSLCIYLTYWAVGCHACRLTRMVAVFMATWLRGLAITVIATGNLARALDCGTGWVLGAGELVTFVAALIDDMR